MTVSREEMLALADKFERLRAAYKAHWLVKDCTAFKEFCFANSDQISAALRSQGGSAPMTEKELRGRLEDAGLYAQAGQADVRQDGADEAMKKIWADWFAFYSNHFRASGITLSMADQMAFYEIAQPILRALASPPPSASQASCSPPRKDGQ